MQVLKLGTMITDKASKVEGMLTHRTINMDGMVEYICQPKSLKKTGKPANLIQLSAARVEGGVWIDLDVPIQILGTIAEDRASGLKGMIVDIVYHMDDCIHASIKPEGFNEDGNTHDSSEMDIRRLIGPEVDILNKLINEGKTKRPPSPIEFNLSTIGH